MLAARIVQQHRMFKKKNHLITTILNKGSSSYTNVKAKTKYMKALTADHYP